MIDNLILQFQSIPILNQENVLFLFEVRIVINEKKNDEFIQYCHTILDEFKKEKGYRALHLYQGTDQSNIYALVSEWQSQKAMDQHLRGNTFSLLKGAAIVLGKNFEIRFGEHRAKPDSQWKRLILA